MSLFKKSLKVGCRVATIRYNFGEHRDELKTGKIIAIKAFLPDLTLGQPYAVRFDDGGIELLSQQELFTEWGEE